MSSYNLNKMLKARKSTQTSAHKDGTVDLGDVSRVKVLSPGRQVFKRFIRNRLAVLGTAILLLMFFFSFVLTIFYPYGQKKIFYTYKTQNVDYSLAKVNSSYNGYVIDDSVEPERKIMNAMNSNIKRMLSEGTKEEVVLGQENGYLIKEEADHIFSLSELSADLVCSAGSSTVKVGTYTMIGKEMAFDKDEIPGLAEEAAKSVKGASGSFTVDGTEYTFEKGGKPKTFDIYTVQDGFVYTGEELGADFEKAAAKAMEEGGTFSYKNTEYGISRDGERVDIYALGDPVMARLYTTYTLDTYITGEVVTEDFRPNALKAFIDGTSFSSGFQTIELKEVVEGESSEESMAGDTSEAEASETGTSEAEEPSSADALEVPADAEVTEEEFTIEASGEDTLVITDAERTPFGEFSLISVRRYSGEDSMDYTLKKQIADKIEEMQEAGEKKGTLTVPIPEQNEEGAYVRDADGNFVLEETEMKITQRLEGEYVLNCDQLLYKIDRFASPSHEHILGTDGDGFDVFARIMYGGRVSLMVGFVVVFIETLIGVILGGIAGYFGGWVDNLVMRMVDVFYCIPSLPIMIILGALMDAAKLPSSTRIWVMMAVLGLLGWAGVARLVRGQILSLREQEFMVATEATGIKVRSRIFRHLIPNVMPQLIVSATMGLGGVILTESTLSFLGLGVKHPLATWGTIINSVTTASAMEHYAFIWIPVGLLICLTVIAFNFVGDGLRDAYDPKAKR